MSRPQRLSARSSAAAAWPWRVWLADALYGVAGVLVGPALRLSRWMRGKRSVPLRDRLGGGEPLPPVTSGRRLWIHAVSVGEVLAARSLVAALLERDRDLQLVFSVTTPTGLDTARRVYSGHRVLPAPFDFSWCQRRFQARLGASALVLVELELWPNQLTLAARAGLAVFVANGRVSARSARGYRRLRFLLGPALHAVTRWLVQEQRHAKRFASLGIPAERIGVTGSLKLDHIVPSDPGEERATLRREHGFPDEAPILVAGSTHEGEERAWLEVQRELRRRSIPLRLVLVPRHPERVAGVLSGCEAAALRVASRSQPGLVPDPDVLVVDTMGELERLYALGDLAFVGGTLVPIGGHNPLEPARLGLPTMVGPHLAAIGGMARTLEGAGVLHVVKERAQLAPRAMALLGDGAAAERAAAGIRRVHREHRGAASRCAEEVLHAIGPGAR